MKKTLKNNKGFTLIELIVVIAIIAILAAISIPAFSGVISNAKKANVQSVARNAYTLAQVNLLEDEIQGITVDLTDADKTAICDEAGTTTAECTIEYTAGTGTTVEVTIDGYTAKYDGSKME